MIERKLIPLTICSMVVDSDTRVEIIEQAKEIESAELKFISNGNIDFNYTIEVPEEVNNWGGRKRAIYTIKLIEPEPFMESPYETSGTSHRAFVIIWSGELPNINSWVANFKSAQRPSVFGIPPIICFDKTGDFPLKNHEEIHYFEVSNLDLNFIFETINSVVQLQP